MSSRLAFFLLAALASACDHGTPARKPVPTTLETAGTYALASPIDLPPTVLASQSVVDYLALLKKLRTDPAAAFVQALDEAGVPYATDLFGILPSALRSQVTSAINDYVAGQNGGDTNARSELDRIIAFSESSLLRFVLDSQLTVPLGADLAAVAGNHAVVGITLGAPVPLTVPRSALTSLPVASGALDAAPIIDVQGGEAGHGDASLAIGDHFFGLAYGEILFAALDGNGTGPSLRTRLGAAFDCAAMGSDVAGHCVLGVCIGHASDIASICESGLDLAVAKLHAQLSALSFKAIHLSSGLAQMWDQAASEPVDGRVSRIDRGTWQAAVDVGTGSRSCPATFTGTRLSP
jgi:hypothetical protein